MRRLKAILCLFLFLFSTAGTYASVHQCKGEVTEIAILTVASCDHEKPQEVHCASDCCKKEKSTKREEEEKSKDCCDTELLGVVKSKITKTASHELQLISKILPSFYDFYFEHPKVLFKSTGLAYVRPVIFRDRDICVEVQSFRI